MKEFKQIQHFQLTYDIPCKDTMTITKHLPSFLNLISLTVNGNCGGFQCNNEFATMIFRQNFPFLQRMYLDGKLFDHELKISDNVCMFYFPSLLYIHVSKLHVILALQLLDQCPQLRSFSAKLYGHPIRDNTTSSAILLPTRISMGLIAMKKLSLGQANNFGNEFGSAFLERLLPCCSNLRTFNLDICCWDNWERLIEADWWAHVFGSDNKLKRISLHLQWTTIDRTHNWREKFQRFQSSSFFTRLKADIRYGSSSDFLRSFTYDLYIKN
jgi:hypothetical protein